MMEIIEQQLVGKKSQETCEDGIVVTNAHVAVIDGSTSKTAIRINPAESNGRYCMQLVSETIASLPSETNCSDFCNIVTDTIAKAYLHYHIDPNIIEQYPERRLTCSAAVYSDYHREVWMIGDCQCLVDGVLYENNKPQEAVNAQKRSEYIQSHHLSADEIMKHDVGRDFIVNDIISSMKSQNKTYAVIDGTPIFMNGVKIIDVSNAREIVLATDGYPFLKPTLAESEEALEELLRDDPMLVSLYKATKGVMQGNQSFDDRAYIRFRPTTFLNKNLQKSNTNLSF